MTIILEAFKLIPLPLQKQTSNRLGIGMIFLFLLVPVLFMARNTYLWLPIAAAAVFFIISAFMIFRLSVLGNYVIVSGVYQEAGYTALKKRMKYIVMQADGQKIQVAINKRLKTMPAGTPVMLYLSKDTVVYEKDGMNFIYSYLVVTPKEK